jgi:MoaA/NifB/PqqE/SkfB family radical SAM enzyme
VHNCRSIDAFVELAIETGCDGVSFSPMQSMFGQLNAFALQPEDQQAVIRALQQARARLRAASLEHNIEETIARYRMGEAVCAGVPCYVAWLHARVKVDGTVQACNPCQFPLGNLRRQPFREIWNGAGFQEFRRAGLTRQGLVELSRRCGCSYCCHVTDSVRVHRLYKWLLPVFRPAGSRHPAA